MFRCTKELKGLAIDYDGFDEISIERWKKVNSIIKCIFITSSHENKVFLLEHFDESQILCLNIFEKILSPSVNTHGKVLNMLNLETTEFGYVSSNYSFIKKACNFLSATIWVSDMVNYDDTKNLPDLVVENMERLIDALEKNVAGFFGETVMFPEEQGPGSMLHVEFDVDGDEIPMYVVGRYFGHSHYMSQLHPYSSSIYLNKKIGKPYEGVFNGIFGKIYAAVITLLSKEQRLDGICSVPVKPGKENRFMEILNIICSNCNIEDMSSSFFCLESYPDQKGLDSEERGKNINGVFKYIGNLTGKTIVLIDDIVTTGATLRECVRVLRNAGAKKVIAVVMAINQIGASYWSTELPKVSCPICGSKMTLLVRGKGNGRGRFFYSCTDCYRNSRHGETLSFSDGWTKFLTDENVKFATANNNVNIKEEWLDDEWIDDSFNLKRIVQCPYCGKENEMDLAENCNVSSKERPMGAEALYQFDTVETSCCRCGKEFGISGYICEYPVGAVDDEEIKIYKMAL